MSRVSKDCARPTPNEKQSAIQGGGRPRGELAAPVRRVDISDRPGERPRMTGRIDACVLPLAVGKIFRIANDPSAVFAGARKKCASIAWTLTNAECPLPSGASAEFALGNDDRAALELKLRPVSAASQSNLEAKGFLEPSRRGWDVRIFEDRDDRACRHGQVRPHSASDVSRRQCNIAPVSSEDERACCASRAATFILRPSLRPRFTWAIRP